MIQKSIGLRVKPNEVFYSIFQKDDDEVTHIISDTLSLPQLLGFPEKLKFVRNTVLDIITQYGVTLAGIRIMESSGVNQNISTERLAIEAVIQEGLASSKVLGYYSGRISTIAPRIGIATKDFKEYVSNNKNYEPIDNWDKYSLESREAIFTSLGCFN